MTIDFDFEFFLTLATLLSGLIWWGFWLLCKLRDQPPDHKPKIVEQAHSLLPVLLIVLLLRSFIVEPFRIPSGSMMPTLLIGDFILVNKFIYGIRLPILHAKILEIGEPQRGDIVVFRYPKDPSVDYIKRVIGLPGDHIVYINNRLYINGEEIPIRYSGRYVGSGENGRYSGALIYEEDLSVVGGKRHKIMFTNDGMVVAEYAVPAGHYFVLGDNRNNSNDSRFWGFVPEENLVGKAFLIWMHFDLSNPLVALERIGTWLQ